MTERERILAAFSGKPVDRVPWAPRMDLWYIALRERGSLPDGFDGLDTAGIADRLVVACHAVRGDRTIARDPGDLLLRGLGLDNHPDYPFRFQLHELDAVVRREGDLLVTTFSTSRGEVVTALETTADMRRNGISLPFVRNYPLQSIDDLDAVCEIFGNIEVVATPQAYQRFHERIGHRGPAVAAGPIAASPMHLILHELMPMDRFFYAYMDAPEKLRILCRVMEPLFAAMLDAICECCAESIAWGGNYDRDLTWPPFFEREIMPWLKRVAQRVHGEGKRLTTHTDGENQGLLELYRRCGFDVAESVCPAPMTSLKLREARDGFGEDITVWGGVPSVTLMAGSMDDRAFSQWLEGLAGELQSRPRRLVLGVADNVPPDADLSRLERIGRVASGS
jgi:uroporphyrinogen-III decarboxylase